MLGKGIRKQMRVEPEGYTNHQHGPIADGRPMKALEHKTEFLIRLRAERGNWRAPVHRRLSLALKVLLRRFGMRCIECKPSSKEEQ